LPPFFYIHNLINKDSNAELQIWLAIAYARQKLDLTELNTEGMHSWHQIG